MASLQAMTWRSRGVEVPLTGVATRGSLLTGDEACGLEEKMLDLRRSCFGFALPPSSIVGGAGVIPVTGMERWRQWVSANVEMSGRACKDSVGR